MILKHPLNFNTSPYSPKPWMTEKEGQCGPGSPLCEATVVIGSEQCYATADSPGIPRLHFIFSFYLLRCCSSSQNKSFIAISSWPCTRTPRALIELPASGIISNPKSASRTSLSFFVFGGFSVPLTLPPSTFFAWCSIYKTDLGCKTKDAVVGAAARGTGGGGRGRNVSLWGVWECVLFASPPSMSPTCAWKGGK